MATFSCLSNQQGCQAHSQPHAVKGHRSPKYPEKQRYEDRQEEMEVGSMKNRRMDYRELTTLLGTQAGRSLWDSYCLRFRRCYILCLILYHCSFCQHKGIRIHFKTGMFRQHITPFSSFQDSVCESYLLTQYFSFSVLLGCVAVALRFT